jgi:hypothetical protein
MPDIFDSALRTDSPETLDHQRKLLRGVRTKRAFSKKAQRVEVTEPAAAQNQAEQQIEPQILQSESVMQDNISAPAIAAEPAPRRKRMVDDYSEVMRDERPNTNPFNAYVPKPFRTFFSSQQSQEQIILVLRKHPITQIKWLLTALVLAFVPFLFNSVSLLGFLPANYQFAGLILWYLLLTGFIFESFLTWFFNVYIITDERIIDVDFLSLIYRNVSSAKIDNIEDVTATTGGAIRAMFDFGNVQIQTAAEKREFEFEDVPHPNRVTKLLNELLLEEELEKIEGRVN